MWLVNSLYAISRDPKIANITGRAVLSCGVYPQYFSGFCYGGDTQPIEGVTTGTQPGNIYFDASRCSDVYSGTGNDLNPLSLTCKFFIRY